MAKAKTPTPQEIYRARKQREEQEKLALLPPGLFNHGNTCFMNSVLQGLIATRLLSLLVHRAPIPPSIQAHSANLLSPRRSPQLTNGDKRWGVPMPIGEAFLNVMSRAWDVEYGRRRENLSPKLILSALGKKYDQYLDFAQQDAHEFLRILLDAMGMEEFDAIKKSQPPQPPPTSKKRRRSSVPKLPDDVPMSLADMIFGGKLASILVCQKCKHVSHTYEDFNDLSLSIKSEDYQTHSKKRDRFKSFAKKLGVSLGSSSSIPDGLHVPQLRASSVPPSPRERPDGFGELVAAAVGGEDPRRRSLDLPPEQVKPEDDTAEHPARVNGVSVVITPDERHIEFVDQPKVDKKSPTDPQHAKKDKEDDTWTKLGRRLSLGLGSKGSKDKERKGRSAERASRDFTYAALRPHSASSTPRSSSSDQPPEIRRSSGAATPKSRPSTPSTSPLNIQTFTIVAPQPRHPEDGPLVARSKSPKPPKPTAGEAAYLRQILADVASGSGAGDAAAAWLKLGGGLPGVEECLRMFTAVEVLDGENMVGCRRCWKIANGEYVPKVRPEDYGPPEVDSEDSADSPVVSTSASQTPIHRPSLPTSISTPVIPTLYSRSIDISSGDSASSLPLVTPPSSSSQFSGDDTDTMTPPSSASSVQSLPISSSSEHDQQVQTPPATKVTIIPPTPAAGSVAFDVTVTEVGGESSLDSITEGVEGSEAGLHPPQLHHHRNLSSDESTDGSSGEESDVSAASSTPPDAEKAHQPVPSPGPKPANSKKAPKPVIMRPAYKRYLIATPPPVLVIHLKRFQQISKNAMMMSFSTGFKKLDDYVAFPEMLDLTPFLAPKKEDYGLKRKGTVRLGKRALVERDKCMYRLYAVVVHIGNMLGGHYISYVALPTPEDVPSTTPKTPDTANSESSSKPDTRQWAYISDTVVRLTTLEEVLKAKAYICMYERV
ncbi:hypothetical protein C8F01DRAFT_1026539 [Mycena amicta]|nr:hypothetical protein C8F01DRAFT_1026539 [Mycena amicta]